MQRGFAISCWGDWMSGPRLTIDQVAELLRSTCGDEARFYKSSVAALAKEADKTLPKYMFRHGPSYWVRVRCGGKVLVKRLTKDLDSSCELYERILPQMQGYRATVPEIDRKGSPLRITVARSGGKCMSIFIRCDGEKTAMIKVPSGIRADGLKMAEQLSVLLSCDPALRKHRLERFRGIVREQARRIASKRAVDKRRARGEIAARVKLMQLQEVLEKMKEIELDNVTC